MIGRTIGGALMGVEGYCVRIEIQIGFGMANFYTVGLAEGAVREVEGQGSIGIYGIGFVFSADLRDAEFGAGRCPQRWFVV